MVEVLVLQQKWIVGDAVEWHDVPTTEERKDGGG
jgi:hypothetical protein